MNKLKFGKTVAISLPVFSINFSKYICTQGGIPLISLRSAFLVSLHIASIFSSHEEILLVLRLGSWFRLRYQGVWCATIPESRPVNIPEIVDKTGEP